MTPEKMMEFIKSKGANPSTATTPKSDMNAPTVTQSSTTVTEKKHKTMEETAGINVFLGGAYHILRDENGLPKLSIGVEGKHAPFGSDRETAVFGRIIIRY